jgi:hypothetical protein
MMQSSLFIRAGGGGVVSRNCLDTVARNPEDACQLRRSEGDVFYQNSRVFVESDHRSQPASLGASVGELGKNLTPSKRRVCQNS